MYCNLLLNIYIKCEVGITVASISYQDVGWFQPDMILLVLYKATINNGIELLRRGFQCLDSRKNRNRSRDSGDKSPTKLVQVIFKYYKTFILWLTFPYSFLQDLTFYRHFYVKVLLTKLKPWARP